MNADGSNPVNLSNNVANDSQSYFFPDGKRIAFSSTRGGNLRLGDGRRRSKSRQPDSEHPHDR